MDTRWGTIFLSSLNHRYTFFNQYPSLSSMVENLFDGNSSIHLEHIFTFFFPFLQALLVCLIMDVHLVH